MGPDPNQTPERLSCYRFDFSNPPVQGVRSEMSWAPHRLRQEWVDRGEEAPRLVGGRWTSGAPHGLQRLGLDRWIWRLCGVDSHGFLFEGFVCFSFVVFWSYFFHLLFLLSLLVAKMIFSCLILNLVQGTCKSLTCNFFPKILPWKSMRKTRRNRRGSKLREFVQQTSPWQRWCPNSYPKTWEFPFGIQPLFKGDNPNFRWIQRLQNVNCRLARSNF